MSTNETLPWWEEPEISERDPEVIEEPDLAQLIDDRLVRTAPINRACSAATLEESLRRQLEGWDESKAWISGSQVGHCRRKLWYRRIGQERERELDGRAKRTFAHGMAAEWWLCGILEAALEETEDWRLIHWNPQRQVELTVAGVDMTGYPDGVLTYQRKPYALLECKSTNQYAFGRYEREGIDSRDSYWWQMQAYMRALGVDRAAFLTECKNSQAINCQWVSVADEGAWDRLTQHVDIAAKSDATPGRILAGGGELKPEPSVYLRATKGKAAGDPKPDHFKLSWQCAYCDFPRACWGPSMIETVDRDWQGKPKRALYMPDPERASHPSGCVCQGCKR